MGGDTSRAEPCEVPAAGAASRRLGEGLGERIRRLRQARSWTQETLGERLGVGQKQISAYERGVHLPSTEVLLRLADVFGTTLDGLAFSSGHVVQHAIADRELLDLATAVDRLGMAERAFAKEALELLVMRARVRSMVGAAPDPASKTLR